jgi:hypothetical protein
MRWIVVLTCADCCECDVVRGAITASREEDPTSQHVCAQGIHAVVGLGAGQPARLAQSKSPRVRHFSLVTRDVFDDSNHSTGPVQRL